MLDVLRFRLPPRRQAMRPLTYWDIEPIFRQAQHNFPFELTEPAPMPWFKPYHCETNCHLYQEFVFDGGILFGERILAQGWLELYGDTIENVAVKCTFDLSLDELVEEELFTGLFRVDEERKLVGEYDVASAKWYLWVD